MNRTKVFKKFLIPTFGAAVIKKATEGSNLDNSTCRPSELPIYGEVCEICTPDPCDDQSALECQIGVLRKELWVWHDKYKGARKEVIDVCETGLAHTASMLEYLKEEQNYMPRYGAIGISGLAGVVLGLRGGVVRRLAYGTGAALAMASVCYPLEAKEITRDTLHSAKKYARVGYNFIYGVKPDYLSLPDPATFLPDDGADVKKPAAKRSMLDSLKATFEDLTNLGSSPPAGPSTSSPALPILVASHSDEKTSRDQSSPADKSLYTTRS